MAARTTGRDFAEVVEEARNRYRLSDIIGRHTRLKPAGRELVGLCFCHSERTPSLRVNDAKGTFHCFGCGASGDAITAVEMLEGVRFIDAIRWLLGSTDLPVISDADRVKALEEDQAARRAAIADARDQWASSGPITGSPGERYLRGRAIDIAIPPSLRFGIVSPWRDRETQEWAAPRPAVVGACTDPDGKLTAIQRIFVKADGSGKATEMGRCKLTLGRNLGSALKLGPAAPEIIVTEGVEDGLSLLQAMPEASVWCGLGTAFLRAMRFPPVVQRVIVAGQNDDAGRHAAKEAAEAYSARGLEVKTAFPPALFKDWNDQLRMKAL